MQDAFLVVTPFSSIDSLSLSRGSFRVLVGRPPSLSCGATGLHVAHSRRECGSLRQAKACTTYTHAVCSPRFSVLALPYDSASAAPSFISPLTLLLGLPNIRRS